MIKSQKIFRLSTGDKICLFAKDNIHYIPVKDVANFCLYSGTALGQYGVLFTAAEQAKISFYNFPAHTFDTQCRKFFRAKDLEEWAKAMIDCNNIAKSGELNKRKMRVERCNELVQFSAGPLKNFLLNQGAANVESLFSLNDEKLDFKQNCLTSNEHKENLSPQEQRNNALGKFGEKIAKNFFESQGYEVVERPLGNGSIDFLAYKNRFGKLVEDFFVEVKTHKPQVKNRVECLQLSKAECEKYDNIRRQENKPVAIFWIDHQSGECFCEELQKLSESVEIYGLKFPQENADGDKYFSRENFGEPVLELERADLAELKRLKNIDNYLPKKEAAPPPAEEKIFAARLKELMTFRGFSHNSEFARVMGISGRTMKNWFEARCLPREKTLDELAKKLGVPAHWLLDK